MGLGTALFLLIDEGLAEGEEEPVSVGDEDVVEELALFSVFGGGGALLNGAEEVGVGPPFVADELVDQEKHGRNLAEGRYQNQAGGTPESLCV